MNKTDSIVESIVRKIEKTAEELSSYTGKKSELTVGGGKWLRGKSMRPDILLFFGFA